MKEIFPYMAIIDPFLTDSLPQDVTLNTGIDAINQAVESDIDINATPLTIEMSTKALKLGLFSLVKLINGLPDKRDRDAMADDVRFVGWSFY